MGCGRARGRSHWPHGVGNRYPSVPITKSDSHLILYTDGASARRSRGRAAIGKAMQSSPTTTRNSTVNTSARGHHAPRSFHAGVLRALDEVSEAALKGGPLDEFLSLVLRT